MADYMIPASVNQSGGITSMPHPHSPGGSWTLLPNESRENVGTSQAFLRTQKVGGGSSLGQNKYRPCPGGFEVC